jgi:hypothetical protein
MLDRILKHGIQPRAVSKHKGNWAHTVPSNRHAVYLTDAYPFHFAGMGNRNEPGLILEIDRDLLLPWRVCPDEDALEQGTRKSPLKGGPPLDASMKQRTLAYRKLARHNPGLADASLKVMGTVGHYGVIPVAAITRYVVIDWEKMDMNLWLMAVDTQVSALNYKILQDRHRAYVRWLFKDPVTAEELIGSDFRHVEGTIGELERKRHAAFTEAMADTSSLQVIVLKQPAKDVA